MDDTQRYSMLGFVLSILVFTGFGYIAGLLYTTFSPVLGLPIITPMIFLSIWWFAAILLIPFLVIIKTIVQNNS
jgi:hypothetical protein